MVFCVLSVRSRISNIILEIALSFEGQLFSATAIASITRRGTNLERSLSSSCSQ